MTKNTLHFGDWLFYKKRVDSDQYDTEPPGDLDTGRLIQGHSDYWRKGSSEKVSTKKTLLLCDWALNDSTKEQLRQLLQAGFNIYLWQESTITPLTEDLLDKSIFDSRPRAIAGVYSRMAELGVSKEAISILDEHTLMHLYDIDTVPYVIQLSSLAEHKYTLEELMDYIKSLNIDFVFNQDELSVSQIDWLNQHQNKIIHFGEIAYNYRSIKVQSSLLRRMERLTDKPSTAFTSLPDFLVQNPSLETVELSDCENLDKLLDLEGISLTKLRALRVSNPALTINALVALLQHTPSIEVLRLSSYTNLAGPLDTREINLTKLKTLELNYFSMATTETLASILKCTPNIKALNLYYCIKLSGSLDLESVSLTKLETLKLCGSAITTPVLASMLQAAPNVEAIDLAGCTDLSDALDLKGIHLTKLKTLTFDSSAITTRVLASMLQATHSLELLDLSFYKNLSEPLDLRGVNLTNLKTLCLRGSTITAETLLSILHATPSLETLDLSWCKNLSGPLDLRGVNLTNLKTLCLRDSTITAETLLSILHATPSLETLDLSWCKNLSGPLDLRGINLTKLKTLDLSDTPITVETLSSILKSTHSIETLDLSSCKKLSGPLDLIDVNLTKLKTLVLSDSAITAETLSSMLKSAHSLETLNLSSCPNFSGPLDLSGVNLTKLKTLDMASSTITADTLLSILKCTHNLETLRLSSCLNLSGPLDLVQHSLTRLKTLKLSFSTIPPPMLTSMLKASSNLETLELIYCRHLSDEFDLGDIDLLKLKTLNLTESPITTRALSSMLHATPRLETLNLSYCKNLSGRLNLDGVDLTNLKEIDLSYSDISEQALIALRDAAPNAIIKANIQPSATPATFSDYNDTSGSTDASNPDHLRDKQLSHQETPPFNYNQRKNELLNQDMVINQLSRYLELIGKHLELIPKIQKGICKPLTDFFLTVGPEAWNSTLKTIQAWNGQKPVSEELCRHFESLIELIHSKAGAYTKQTYIGDNLKRFIQSHAAQSVLSLSNPWHEIGVLYESTTSRYYIYDPNYIDGVHAVSRDELAYEIKRILGPIISVAGDFQLAPKNTIKDINSFLYEGGFFLLALPENAVLLKYIEQKNIRSLFRLFSHRLSLSAQALTGLLLKNTSAHPAWLIGLLSRTSKAFFIDCLKEFIQSSADAINQLEQSLEGLPLEEKAAGLALIKELGTDKLDKLDTQIKIIKEANSSASTTHGGDSCGIDADTNASKEIEFHLKRNITCLNGSNPNVSTYRKSVFDTLEVSDKPTDISHAFRVFNKTDIALSPVNISDSRCDLSALGEYLAKRNKQPLYIGVTTLSSAYQWLPLPSLTTADSLSHIHLIPKVNFELRYSERDNLYYIHITQPIDKPITVQYLFSPAIPADKVSLPGEIQLLVNELNSYGGDTLTIKQTSPSGADYLQAIQTQHVGSCRHRAVAFKSLLEEQFPQYPCRIIINDCHAFAEVKIDGQWLTCDFGGYPAKLTVKETITPTAMQDVAVTTDASLPETKSTALIEGVSGQYRQYFKPQQQMPFDKLCESMLAHEGKHLLQCDSEDTLIAAQSLLFKKAREMRRPIFWVTKPQDLYCQLPYIKRHEQDNSGEVCDGPGGALYDFLMAHQSRGLQPILLIDYSSFKPEEVVRFNSLIDDTKKADGIDLPEDLSIIGLQNKRHPNHYTGEDFTSRFDSKHSISELRDDTAEAMELDADDSAPYIINLYEATDWQERLMGRWQLDGQQLYFKKGELIKALETKRPIHILNAPLASKAYQLFLQKCHMEGAIEGMPFDLAQITHGSDYGWDEKTLSQHQLHQLTAKDWREQQTSSPFLLNPTSFAKLFSTYRLEGEQIHLEQGLLEVYSGQTFNVYISRDLSESQWAELFDKALAYNVTLNICLLPNVVIDKVILKSFHAMDESPDDIVPADGITSPFVVSSDPDVSARERLDDNTFVIDISELSVSDLLLKIDGKYHQEEKAFTFIEEKRLLIRELEAGKKFILTGHLSAEKLDRLLPYLYQYPRQLTLILKEDSLIPPDTYTTETPTFDVKCRWLSMDKQTLLTSLMEGERPVFSYEALSQFSFNELQAFLIHQRAHPDNRDIKASWIGIETTAPSTIDITIDESRADDDTKAFIQARAEAVETALKSAPVAFISGITGCGKSAFIENHLKKQWTVFELTQLLDWAKKPDGGILFIDEANISQKDYSQFEGLFYAPPYIIINDELIELSPKHKLLMAGNPTSYGGSRHTPSLLTRHANAVTFDLMPPNVLFKLVIEPLFQNTPLEAQAFESSLELLEIYQWLLQQDREAFHITPRDIKAIIMRALASIATPAMTDDDSSSSLFEKELHQQIRNIIRPKLPVETLTSFDTKLPEQSRTDQSPLPSYGTFIITESRRALSDELDSTLQLRRYRKDHQADFSQNQLTGDLNAIIVESEPGLGKTELIKAKLRFNGIIEADIDSQEMIKNSYYNLPVTLSVKQKKLLLLKAFVEGNIVIIDEVNSSPMLEQFLNNLLMGQIPQDEDIADSPYLTIPPQPGFIIIGTQNPVYMQGRVSASTAESARRITFTLEPYTDDEMLQVLTHKGLDSLTAQALIKAYNTERYLAQTNHQEVAPNFRDVLRQAEKLSPHKAASQTKKDSASHLASGMFKPETNRPTEKEVGATQSRSRRGPASNA